MTVIPEGDLGERAARRLTAVGSDGTPQPNPVWFLCDGADNPKNIGKYGADMARVSGTQAEFGAAYPVALRIAVRRVRGQ